MTVSKRLRFEILRRDNRQCRYCGARAPETPLTVDHVIPTTLGGTDSPANLVAACRDCNGGKSSVPSGAPLVEDLASDALRWAEAMQRAAQIMAAHDDARAGIYAEIESRWYTGRLPGDWTDTIDRFIDAGLPSEVILRMVRIAQNKRGEMGYRWSYFCGCCWNRVSELQERTAEILRQQDHPNPSTTSVVLATQWTAQAIDEDVAKAEDFASRWLTQESIDSASCAHRDWGEGDCGDPICRIQRAEALRWMADTNLLRSYRGDEVTKEAEALLDG